MTKTIRRFKEVRIRLLLAGTAVVLLAPAVMAHDFWIEPNRFEPDPKEIVTLTLRVGSGFEGEEYSRNPQHMLKFVLRDLVSGEEFAVPGRNGTSPAGYLKFPDQNPMVGYYQSSFSLVSLTPETFASYVDEEQVAHLIPEVFREELKVREDEIKESFARNAKVLLIPGPYHGKPDQAVGLTLELVCLDPLPEIQTGKVYETRWQLLLEGMPLGDHPVALLRKGDKTAAEAMTDDEGIARLPVSQPGVYMVKSLDIVPSTQPDSEWQSQWASSVFMLYAYASQPQGK